MDSPHRRIGIIDLGTNTFNLLIADVNEQGGWSAVFRNSLPVKLALGGIQRSTIVWDRFVRGIDALLVHKAACSNYHCTEIHAFATAAIREADNGKDFVDAAKSRTGIDVLIVDGNREAELIYRGVRQTVELGTEPALIMDIGGGSTEFILCNAKEVLWKASFPLGVSRIDELMELPDPLGQAAYTELQPLLEDALEPLWEAVAGREPTVLIGSSGSFDTLRQILHYRLNRQYVADNEKAEELEISSFKKLTEELCAVSYESRLQMRGMHPMRADTIQLSAVFIAHVLKKLTIKRLMRSGYALKEGALDRIINP